MTLCNSNTLTPYELASKDDTFLATKYQTDASKVYARISVFEKNNLKEGER